MNPLNKPWAALLWALEIENAQPFLKAWKTSRQFAKQVQDLLTILALREKGELSKRDCYRFDLDLLLQAENLRQAQGKPILSRSWMIKEISLKTVCHRRIYLVFQTIKSLIFLP